MLSVQASLCAELSKLKVDTGLKGKPRLLVRREGIGLRRWRRTLFEVLEARELWRLLGSWMELDLEVVLKGLPGRRRSVVVLRRRRRRRRRILSRGRSLDTRGAPGRRLLRARGLAGTNSRPRSGRRFRTCMSASSVSSAYIDRDGTYQLVEGAQRPLSDHQ